MIPTKVLAETEEEIMAKLYTLKEATGGLRHDSVRYRKAKNKGKRYPELLRRCNQAWEKPRILNRYPFSNLKCFTAFLISFDKGFCAIMLIVK